MRVETRQRHDREQHTAPQLTGFALLDAQRQAPERETPLSWVGSAGSFPDSAGLDLGFLGPSWFAAKTRIYGYWIILDFFGFSRQNRDLSMGYQA